MICVLIGDGSTIDIYDPEPKVSVHYLNLMDLYNRVVEEGGYDLVSDTKAKPLMWRKFAEDFLGKSPHVTAQAFQVKSAYYKNLSYVLPCDPGCHNLTM